MDLKEVSLGSRCFKYHVCPGAAHTPIPSSSAIPICKGGQGLGLQKGVHLPDESIHSQQSSSRYHHSLAGRTLWKAE